MIALTILASLQCPAQADPEGCYSGARKAIASAKKIEYYPNGWDEETKAKFEEIDYVYNGIVLSGTGGDFMKKEPVRIVATVKRDDRGVCVSEEVIYPVWSELNHAHVLRSIIFYRYGVPVKNVKGQLFYCGLDKKQHAI